MIELPNYGFAYGPFVWNATNITLQMRDQLTDLFEPYKPRVKLIYVETSYKKLLTQNNDRDHCIPWHAVEKMVDKLEVPKIWEAQELLYVVNL